MEFTTNDSNITKDRHYVAWKEKAKAAKQEAEAVKEENTALKRERTKTVEHVHSLKKKVEGKGKGSKARSGGGEGREYGVETGADKDGGTRSFVEEESGGIGECEEYRDHGV